MPSIVIANYERERELFAELLASDPPHRILLFSGESGVGKSTLLRSCVELVPINIRCIPIELRGAAVGVAEIFYRLGGHIGWNRLENFQRKLFSLEPGAIVQTGKNWLAGIQNQINVSLYSHNLVDRSDRTAALTEALFNDLANSRQLVVLTFDTFDAANTEASEWLAGPLLERVARAKTTRVVIAGQTVPNVNNIEWGTCCELRNLTGIADHNHWLPIVDKLKRLIPHDPQLSWLSGVCDALRGNPAKIMQVIEGLPLRKLET
jgi:energy-coupling factor transporter ATP-binding protein EcfA2